MKTEFLLAARAELEEAIAYYDSELPGLGFEFSNEVEHALERIEHFPRAWSPLSQRVRRCQVNRFPYSVIYEARSGVLIVVAIQNNHRKPEGWRSRIR